MESFRNSWAIYSQYGQYIIEHTIPVDLLILREQEYNLPYPIHGLFLAIHGIFKISMTTLKHFVGAILKLCTAILKWFLVHTSYCFAASWVWHPRTSHGHWSGSWRAIILSLLMLRQLCKGVPGVEVLCIYSCLLAHSFWEALQKSRCNLSICFTSVAKTFWVLYLSYFLSS